VQKTSGEFVYRGDLAAVTGYADGRIRRERVFKVLRTRTQNLTRSKGKQGRLLLALRASGVLPRNPPLPIVPFVASMAIFRQINECVWRQK
jgi:hypothetical protein